MLTRGYKLFCSFREAALYALLLSLALLFSAADAGADVVVFDEVVPHNTSARLRALTKGRFFPEGGRLVTFVVDGKEIGTTLSGGDGYAFYRYTPRSGGVLRFEARAGDDRDAGVIVSMGRRDSLVIVEVESSLIEPSLALTPRPDSVNALKEIARDARVLYITTLMGAGRARAWLADHEFPQSAVMEWEGPRILDAFKEDGINVSAIIASPAVLDQAGEISGRYSFQETDSGDKAGSWGEILERLRRQKKP